MFFVIEFSFTIAYYQFLKNNWIFINYGLFFKEDIPYSSNASNLENKSKIFNYSYF